MPQVALIIKDLWKAHINPKCSWETRGLFSPAKCLSPCYRTRLVASFTAKQTGRKARK